MRAVPALLVGATLCCGLPAAAEQSPPGHPDTIHVSAVRDPEVRKYKAIVAGLDAFDKHHRYAPAVDALRFRVARSDQAAGEARSEQPGAPLSAPLSARLEGRDGFLFPLSLDGDRLLSVPRSEAALEADSELLLNQKRRHYRIEPHVLTPGLPANVRRLGDLRLECKVKVAIAKEEIGLLLTLTVNTVLRTTDWCAFFNEKERGFWFNTPRPIVAAVLKEGERSQPLESSERGVRIPLHEGDWSDEAVVEMAFAADGNGAEGVDGKSD